MVSFVAYYVVGGEFSDTTFRQLVKPAPVAGPFETYVQAYEAWRSRSLEMIDQAYARFQIVQTVDVPAGIPGQPEATRA